MLVRLKQYKQANEHGAKIVFNRQLPVNVSICHQSIIDLLRSFIDSNTSSLTLYLLLFYDLWVSPTMLFCHYALYVYDILQVECSQPRLIHYN